MGNSPVLCFFRYQDLKQLDEKKIGENGYLALSQIYLPSSRSTSPEISRPVTIDVSCDAHRFLASGA